MIEDILVQWGTLGVWVVYMIYKEKTFYADMKLSIDNNTVATNKLVTVIEYKKEQP